MPKGNRHPRRIVKLQSDGRVLIPEWARVVADLMGGEQLHVSAFNLERRRDITPSKETKRLVILEVVEEE